jgi:hypothetical protein
MVDKSKKRRWRNLILDREYQLVFTLAMVVSSALFMAGLGIVVIREADTATKTAIQDIEGESLLDPKLAEETIDNLLRRRAQLDALVIGLGVALAAGLFAYGIKMTHRVAGPLYKVSRACDRVASGHFEPLGRLRRGDQLVEFFEHFKQAHETVRRDVELDVAALRAAIAAADEAHLAERSPELAARLEELRGLCAAKEASLA